MAKGDHSPKHDAPAAASGAVAPSGAVALLRDALSHVYDSSIVYGEPVVFGDRVVIPAARVASGGGGGYALTPTEGGAAELAEEGAGMGHGVWARPIGYIEVTADDSRWVPAFDVGSFVIAVCVTIVLVVVAWCFRRRTRRCRR
jgi:uncharacterized spore protein YtfJ